MLNISQRFHRRFTTNTSGKPTYPRHYPSSTAKSAVSPNTSSSSSYRSPSSTTSSSSPQQPQSSSSPAGTLNSSYRSPSSSSNSPPYSSSASPGRGSTNYYSPPSGGARTSNAYSPSSVAGKPSTSSSLTASLPPNSLIITNLNDANRYVQELNKLDPSQYTFAWRTEVADWTLGESTLHSGTVIAAALYFAPQPKAVSTTVTSNRYRTTTTNTVTNPSSSTESLLPSRVWIDNLGSTDNSSKSSSSSVAAAAAVTATGTKSNSSTGKVASISSSSSTSSSNVREQPLQAFRSHFYNYPQLRKIVHSANFHIHTLERYFNGSSSSASVSSSSLSSTVPFSTIPYTADTLRMGWLLGEKNLGLSALTKHYNDNPKYQLPELLDVFGVPSPTNPRKKILPDVRFIQTNPIQRNAWIRHSLLTIESTWYLYYKLMYNFDRIAWNPDYRLSSYYTSGRMNNRLTTVTEGGGGGETSGGGGKTPNRPTFSDCYRTFVHPATETLMNLESNSIHVNMEQIQHIHDLVQESIRVLQGEKTDSGTTSLSSKGNKSMTEGKKPSVTVTRSVIPSYTENNTFINDDTFFTNAGMGLDLQTTVSNGTASVPGNGGGGGEGSYGTSGMGKAGEGLNASAGGKAGETVNTSSPSLASAKGKTGETVNTSSPSLASNATNVFLRPAVLQRISEIYELVNNNPIPGLYVPKYPSTKYGSTSSGSSGGSKYGTKLSTNQVYVQHLQQFTSSVLEPFFQVAKGRNQLSTGGSSGVSFSKEGISSSSLKESSTVPLNVSSTAVRSNTVGTKVAKEQVSSTAVSVPFGTPSTGILSSAEASSSSSLSVPLPFHPSYNPNTVNGRVLCARPFLLDRHLALETGILHSFVPSHPRNTLITLRLPYLELFVLAHGSQSSSLWSMLEQVRIYEQENRTNPRVSLDERTNYLHRLTAYNLYGKSTVDTNPSFYIARARDINEGLPNGRTPYGLAKSWAAGDNRTVESGLTTTTKATTTSGGGPVVVQSFLDADHDIQTWFHQYPEIYPWIETLTQQVQRNQGILHTLGGRLRKLTLPKPRTASTTTTAAGRGKGVSSLSSFAQHTDDTAYQQTVQRLVLSSFVSGSIADISLAMVTRWSTDVYTKDELRYRPVFYGWDGIVLEGPMENCTRMVEHLQRLGRMHNPVHNGGDEEMGIEKGMGKIPRRPTEGGGVRSFGKHDGIDKRSFIVRISTKDEWWEGWV